MDWVVGSLIVLVVLIVGAVLLLGARARRARRDRVGFEGADVSTVPGSSDAEAQARLAYGARNADLGGGL